VNELNQETREAAILGSFLLFKETLIFVEKLDLWMLTLPSSIKVFKIIRELSIANRLIEVDSVKVEIDDLKIEDEEFFNHCIRAAFPIDLIFVEVFIERAYLRIGCDKLSKLIKTKICYKEFIQEVDKIRNSISILNKDDKEFLPGSFLDKRLAILQRREEVKQIFFGIPPLDELIQRGQRKREISVIAARSTIGKSLFRSNLIKIQCGLGFKIAAMATEQTSEVETDRIDSLITGIPLTEIENSRLWKADDERITQIINANKMIDEKWKYYLHVNRNITTVEFANWLRRLVDKERGIDVCYIDLFDKFIDVNISENKASKTSEKLGYMNQLAEELDIHLCLIVQINREVRKEKGFKPKIWHLKDSGAYEEIARLILLLHREKYYNSSARENILEVNVGKQSNGPAGDGITTPLILNENTLELTWQQRTNPNIFSN